MMNFLKQENQRLNDLVHSMQNSLSFSTLTAELSTTNITTKDIELSTLNSEVATALPDRKIFINEVLTSTARNQYIFIK